jgi:hypothetical protein
MNRDKMIFGGMSINWEYRLVNPRARLNIPCNACIGETHAGIPGYTVSLSSLVGNAGTIVL